MTNTIAVFLCFGMLLGCIAVLGLCLKLYTEYFKDKAISSRKERPSGD